MLPLAQKILASKLHLGTSSPGQGTPYDNFSLPAQLNCDADKVAAMSISEHPTYDLKTALVFPASGCQLQLTTGAVTYDIKQALEFARTVPPLQS